MYELFQIFSHAWKADRWREQQELVGHESPALETGETPGRHLGPVFQREFILTFDAMACLSMLSSEHFLVCVYNQASEHVFTGAGGISCPAFAPRSKQGPAAKQQGRTKAIKGRTYWKGVGERTTDTNKAKQQAQTKKARES